MKMTLRGLCAAMSLSALFVSPAYATDTLYMPPSSAIPSQGDPDNYCYVTAIAIAATQPATFCEVGFPVTIPVGHTIKQIAVMHDDNLLFPDPYIQAELDTRQMFAPFLYDDQFHWDSQGPVPGGTIVTSRLMAQTGKLYPDAFVVQMGIVYTVVVRLVDGAVIDGLQITYE